MKRLEKESILFVNFIRRIGNKMEIYGPLIQIKALFFVGECAKRRKYHDYEIHSGKENIKGNEELLAKSDAR